MSRENKQAKPYESNDNQSFNTQQELWIQSDSGNDTHQNRTCCSPVDEIEAMENDDDNLNTTHNVEVQTDKSSLLSINENKRSDNVSKKIQILSSKENPDMRKVYPQCSNSKNDPTNELERVKLRKTNFYEQEKASRNMRVNTPEMFENYAEADSDQPMNYALYDEASSIEDKKETASLSSKSDFSQQEESTDVEKPKHKGAFSKESVRNKKELFTNPSRSFKEIFNFFKDRDKKRNNIDNTKALTNDGPKLLKSTETSDQKLEKISQVSQSPTASEQSDKEPKSKNDMQCSQQTPIMFSRCSSLSSLTGCEQHSVQDDRSSILSDLSHRTSGLVSPSELPDSPAQLAVSKLQQKSQMNFFGKRKLQLPQQEKNKICQSPVATSESTLPQIENNWKKPFPTKYSVFEDDVTPYKDESTPTKLHSMAASSLSSLTIDDDDDGGDYELINKIVMNKEKENYAEDIILNNDRQEPIGESASIEDSSSQSENVSNQQSDEFNGEEDDEITDLTSNEEKLLDECIRQGIAKWTGRNINDIKPFSWDLSLTCEATKAIIRRHFRNSPFVNIVNNNNNSEFLDSHENYKSFMNNRTEGINSNESETTVNNKLNDSYLLSYEEHLLDQCIRRGMAKITKTHINCIEPFSWDINNLCLTTRAMILNGRTESFYSFY